jgi:hypothetical protein
MKKILVILILFSIFRYTYANNWCTRENSIEAKKINQAVYTIIYNKRESLDLIDKYLFTGKIFTKISDKKSKTENNIIKCAISGILYRLNWDEISYTKNIDIENPKFLALPKYIQNSILNWKKSIF